MQKEIPLSGGEVMRALIPDARISKKYLCVPATSTSSERVVSKGGLIVTPHRASLKPETAEMLIFLSSNL